MKVGIVTITNGPCNYGNQLQNSAVIVALDKLNIKADTLFYVYKAEYLASIKHKLKNRVLSTFRIGDYLQAHREMAFETFSNKYVRYTKPIREFVPQEIIDRYAFFICGSDQVWNPNFSTDNIMWNYYLLSFAPGNKRVSFAASIGVSDIPEEQRKDFVSALNGYKAISIREEAGATLINKIVGRTAETIIDPTLMLNREEWNKIAKKPKKIDCDKKYVLTYFLGGKSERVFNQIEKLRKDGYEIYNLLDRTQPELYVADPAEFVYLMSKASLILTDSFHACVFAFIYERPYLVYAREGKENGMISRIDTLLSKFGMQRKYIDSGLENELFEHDYSKGKMQLNEERDKSVRFLKKALEIK